MKRFYLVVCDDHMKLPSRTFSPLNQFGLTDVARSYRRPEKIFLDHYSLKNFGVFITKILKTQIFFYLSRCDDKIFAYIY